MLQLLFGLALLHASIVSGSAAIVVRSGHKMHKPSTADGPLLHIGAETYQHALFKELWKGEFATTNYTVQLAKGAIPASVLAELTQQFPEINASSVHFASSSFRAILTPKILQWLLARSDVTHVNDDPSLKRHKPSSRIKAELGKTSKPNSAELGETSKPNSAELGETELISKPNMLLIVGIIILGHFACIGGLMFLLSMSEGRPRYKIQYKNFHQSLERARQAAIEMSTVSKGNRD